MKTKVISVLTVLILSGLVLALPQISAAQDNSDQQAPPTRAARLNYVEGSVSFEPNGSQDWVQAQLNRPLTTGDNLWADQNSRAEVHIGSTAFRLGNQTGISFLNLADNAVQVQLAQGTLEVSVRHLGPDDAYEIATPNLAFSILQPGEYRLEADPNGSTTVVTAYTGQGTVTGGGQTFNVAPEQSVTFTGTNQLSANVQRAAGADSFEDWARSREDREERVVASRYVSDDVTGYADLDDYGTWRSDPDFGEYWAPTAVGPDWQPYRVGNWCWISPWGWTWVDDEPWGFAPFHYGRWAIINGGWGWVPGPVAVRPVYAPALVGFVGGGASGVGIGFSFGQGVGWYPLGPRDVYIPPYQVTPVYVQQVNLGGTRMVNRTTIVNVYNNYTVNHVTNINYTYAANPRAVTVVNRNTFVSGRPIATSAMRVSPAELQHPRVMTTAALTPSRTSVVGPATTARVRPPATLANRRIVTKMQPSPRAQPIGRPRPKTNPNLTPAALNRSGYSPQLQTIRATAAARAPARAAAPEPNRPVTAPNQPRPSDRPFTPPNRANEGQPRPNEPRPFTPPNHRAENPQPNGRPTPTNQPAAHPEPQPRSNGERRTTAPPEHQPAHPEAQPHPQQQPHHEAKPKPAQQHPQEHPKQPPPKEKPQHPQPNSAEQQ